MDPTLPSATIHDFEEKYATLRSAVARSIRVESLGSEIPHGYTTVGLADRLGDLLGLRPGELLLGLGSGRGWPGDRVAERSGARFIASDIPLSALRTAAARWGEEGRDDCSSVCADGRILPFRDRTFGGVTHADVLC